MGCGASGGSDPCPDEEKLNWKDCASDDSEFEEEANFERKYYDSKKGQSAKKGTEKPEDFDFF